MRALARASAAAACRRWGLCDRQPPRRWLNPTFEHVQGEHVRIRDCWLLMRVPHAGERLQCADEGVKTQRGPPTRGCAPHLVYNRLGDAGAQETRRRVAQAQKSSLCCAREAKYTSYEREEGAREVVGVPCQYSLQISRYVSHTHKGREQHWSYRLRVSRHESRTLPQERASKKAGSDLAMRWLKKTSMIKKIARVR